ncbi:MAG: hypothetical protein R3B99_23090 [Polyangiales bacterium]
MILRGFGIALLCAVCLPLVARANPEPPATYDARVTGMGGVAVATVDSAAALFHNPAQLDRIERFAVTAVATSLLVNLRAPFAGPGTEEESGLIYAPLLFFGAVGRVHERVSLGAGAYVYTGFGGGFPTVECITYGDPSACGSATEPNVVYDPPVAEEVTLFIAELAVPIQVTLIPEVLSAGVTLRMPYGRQAVNATQEALGAWSQAEQSLDGFGVPGVLLGLSYRPIPALTIAAAYRSKVWVDMEGTTSVPFAGETLEIPTSTRWYVPHAFRFGLAYTTWRERLTVTGEFRVQLHREANRLQRFDLQPDAALARLVPDTEARFDWGNVFFGGVAAELWVLPRFPVRVGLTVANSASDPNTMTPFSPPPGVMIGAYGGAGVRLGGLEVDFAFGWGGGPAYDKKDNGDLCTPASERTRRDGAGQILTASGGCAGSYDVDSWFMSLSVTYRVGHAPEPAEPLLPISQPAEPTSEPVEPVEPVAAEPVAEPTSEPAEPVAAEPTEASGGVVEDAPGPTLGTDG